MIEYEKLEATELVLLSRERDDRAFDELVRRYTPMMRKVASGFNNPSISADEAFSEACIALHKALMSYDVERRGITFGLYARICIYRRLSDLFSSKENTGLETGADIDKLVDNRSAMSMLLFKERVQNFITVAREILSEYEYRVFLLYIQGYDTDAMCEELSRDKKSVENAKARMLKHLRAESSRFSDI